MQLSVAVRHFIDWDGWVSAPFREWAAAERGRFGLWLPVFMGGGVVLYFSLRAEPAAWAGVAVAMPAVAGAVLARWRPVLQGGLMAVAAGAIGFASCQLATARALPVEPLPSKGVTVSAVVRGVETLPAGRRIMLEQVRILDSGRALARTVRVKLKTDDTNEIETGDTVRLRVLIRAPNSPAYPGGWDLQRDAYFSGLGGYGMALGPAEVTAHTPPLGAGAWIRWLRDTVQHRILAVLPGAEGGIAATLLTGITVGIPEADRAAFRDFGLAHLLAVAGLHIGIVMGLMLGFSRMALALSERASLFWPCKQIAALVALACGGFYMVMTGMHLPILRSFAMACLFTLAVLAGRRAISVRGLALAGVAIMAIEPWEVVGVSFQMSFSAVLALIAGYEAMRPWLLRLKTAPVWGEGTWGRRLALHVAALALTSLLAGTASAPYGAYHFGRVQVYFVISNMAGGAADGDVGDADRIDRAGADAAPVRGAGAGADGLGRGCDPVDRARGNRPAGRHLRRAAYAGLGPGGVVAGDRLVGDLAHEMAPGRDRSDRAGAGLAGVRASSGPAGFRRCQADRTTHGGGGIRAEDRWRVALRAGCVAAILGFRGDAADAL